MNYVAVYGGSTGAVMFTLAVLIFIVINKRGDNGTRVILCLCCCAYFLINSYNNYYKALQKVLCKIKVQSNFQKNMLQCSKAFRVG